MRLGVGGAWSTVGRTRLGWVGRGRCGVCWHRGGPAAIDHQRGLAKAPRSAGSGLHDSRKALSRKICGIDEPSWVVDPTRQRSVSGINQPGAAGVARAGRQAARGIPMSLGRARRGFRAKTYGLVPRTVDERQRHPGSGDQRSEHRPRRGIAHRAALYRPQPLQREQRAAHCQQDPDYQ